MEARQAAQTEWEKVAKDGWRVEYIEGNGIDGYLWVSPDGKCYETLPEHGKR